MGKLGEPALAEKVIADGIADFIILGRPLLVDPLWIEKAQRGDEADIVRCIGCLNCFTFNSRPEIVPTHSCCTVNPGVLREYDYAAYTPAETPREILVIGGGLAGMPVCHRSRWTRPPRHSRGKIRQLGRSMDCCRT